MISHLFRVDQRRAQDRPPESEAVSGEDGALALYRWLTGSVAAGCMAEVSQRQEPLVKATARLRKNLSAAETHLVLEQVSLRRKAIEKFARAAEMYFTPLGFEQSTDEVVAAYKAGRFAAGELVADLCCGIGGDLMSLAARGPAVGVDRDPVKALLAAANGRVVLGSAAPCCEVADVTGADLAQVSAWHLDPDRRPRGLRTTRVDDHEPNTETIDKLLACNERAAIKLAPAAVLPEAWRDTAELEWISRAGECRQLVAWFGGLAREPGRVCATRLDRSGVASSFWGLPAKGVSTVENLGRYVYEPDAAVLAAKLEGELAEKHGLGAPSPEVAYLTGDDLVCDPLLSGFEVLAVLPFQAKRLRALLRSRGLGRLEVKKRGVPYDPEELRRQLRVPGDEAGTLIVTRVKHAVTAIVARRIVPQAD